MNRSGYIDVDKLQAEISLQEAAAKCGVSVEVKGTGPEVRIDCPFNCVGDHIGRKEIAVNLENPQKVFQCHAYSCGFRGNLLCLMHGFTTGTKPTGEKLKGVEFQRIKNILAGKIETGKQASATIATPKIESIANSAATANPPPAVNIPLIDSTDERVRELHNIDVKLVTDVARMNPAAGAYVRQHPCLFPESMKKWRCGYMPNDGGGDKRGWSLRGQFVYPVFSGAGKVLAWVGRDVHHESKERDYQKLTPAERAGKEPPAKHRFPKGFHRGQELFGQQASRLNEPGYREFIGKNGLIIVEGFNDVINLDNLGIPSLAIMSNRITDAQAAKIALWARQLGNSRVNLMFDNDEPGVEGAKEALWLFAEHRLQTHLVWSTSMHNGAYNRMQPELITKSDFNSLLTELSSVRP